MLVILRLLVILILACRNNVRGLRFLNLGCIFVNHNSIMGVSHLRADTSLSLLVILILRTNLLRLVIISISISCGVVVEQEQCSTTDC